jgi:RNA polymerase sigma factor (sigma-70 family)
MVSALTRIFGVHNLALAEDVVQDSLCRALEVWKFQGVPDNPAAWLMATAKHRALDLLRRERTARVFAPDVTRLLETEWTLSPTLSELFGEHEIEDDLLRMMFTCCHPDLAEEAQIALILNILCGFSVTEVAGAFLVSHAAMEKRLQRAKATLATSQALFDMAAGVTDRLAAVQRALYLLFNEGYHGAHPETAVRRELCFEAIHLAALLLEHPASKLPQTYALCALFCLDAARLPGRIDADGHLGPLDDRARSTWDRELIAQGLSLLERSATGTELSEYHVEAAIAAEHAAAAHTKDTNWARVVELYDLLFRLRPTPVVALNRAIALAQRDGAEAGLAALSAIAQPERLASYPFYFAAQADLELSLAQSERAAHHFRAALGVARNPAERHFFEQRLATALAAPAPRQDPTSSRRRPKPGLR